MRRFFNGLFVGGLIGAMCGLLANDNMKPQRKRILGETKKISNQASKFVEDVTKEVSKIMKRR